MLFSLKPISDSVPEVGTSSPAHKPSKVVLPLPEGPIMARELPCSTRKETESSTVRDRSAER